MALQVHLNENCVRLVVAFGIFAPVELDPPDLGMNGKIFLFCPFRGMLCA